MEEKNELDLDKIKRQFLEEFRSGKPTFGKDGALGPLLKHFLEAALDAEMDLLFWFGPFPDAGRTAV